MLFKTKQNWITIMKKKGLIEWLQWGILLENLRKVNLDVEKAVGLEV